ncbi:hypothetical protein, partial [Alistipes communis]
SETNYWLSINYQTKKVCHYWRYAFLLSGTSADRFRREESLFPDRWLMPPAVRRSSSDRQPAE